ncbi:transglutaminaseTgpA domain-containing protein [Holophaga foetida]|uniref:transglutaminase family protein n=1 Tax=Holophaga foetida TaxID=35839 RepID=UPI001FCAD9F8|nr:transglutaminase domain-containing protein [Holophaga foetida]
MDRWLDHLPPWLSLLALAPSGLFAPGDLAVMVVPLILAAVVEWRQWILDRWRRALELGALASVLLMGAAHIGLLQLLGYLIFILCGIRLVLPRTLPQRRQILLMGFLVFLMAAMSLPSLDFALWAILWTAGAAACLIHQAWSIPASRPPLRPLGAWTLAILLIAAACFMGLPRVKADNRLSAWGIRGFGSGIGLAEALDLSERGPLRNQTGVALRVAPRGTLSPSHREQLAGRMELLKGFCLEALEGARWEVAPQTPQRNRIRVAKPTDPELSPGIGLEFQLAPTSTSLIPLPYGTLILRGPRAWLLEPQPGGGIGWEPPPRHTVSMELAMEGGPLETEPLGQERRIFLTQTSGDTKSADRWSRRIAPEDLPAAAMAALLTAELRSYRYTLSNPSGRAADPLEDFLERTQAGHCEYFASALACALRSRQIPARVAVGYRLGPWIPEGGYWLVTQNEAHSWVEYYDAAARCWRIADPTPTAAGGSAYPLMTRLRHLQDALIYRWDRYILRFSGEDQATGLDWLQRQGEALTASPDRWRRPLEVLIAAGGLGLALWIMRRFKGSRRSPSGIRELTPLLRRTRRICPPAPGETARAWLSRLAALAPTQQERLLRLADEVDLATYGPGSHQTLRALAREASRNFSLPPGAPMEGRGFR